MNDIVINTRHKRPQGLRPVSARPHLGIPGSLFIAIGLLMWPYILTTASCKAQAQPVPQKQGSRLLPAPSPVVRRVAQALSDGPEVACARSLAHLGACNMRGWFISSSIVSIGCYAVVPNEPDNRDILARWKQSMKGHEYGLVVNPGRKDVALLPNDKDYCIGLDVGCVWILDAAGLIEPKPMDRATNKILESHRVENGWVLVACKDRVFMIALNDAVITEPFSFISGDTVVSHNLRRGSTAMMYESPSAQAQKLRNNGLATVGNLASSSSQGDSAGQLGWHSLVSDREGLAWLKDWEHSAKKWLARSGDEQANRYSLLDGVLADCSLFVRQAEISFLGNTTVVMRDPEKILVNDVEILDRSNQVTCLRQTIAQDTSGKPEMARTGYVVVGCKERLVVVDIGESVVYFVVQ